MENNALFIEKIKESYNPKGEFVYLGSGILNEKVIAPAQVNLALKMMNRHGLVAGATGTGKTRTLQLMTEQLSAAGVPVFMLDVKGDLSGLAEKGESNPALIERGETLEYPFVSRGFPVELFSLSGKKGIPLRIKISDFGPIMLARVLDLNDTQTGVLTAIFKYADDHQIALINFDDLKALLNFLSGGPGAEEIKNDYGKISSSTSGTIMRKIVSVEQQGLSDIFGEPAFDINDLFQKVDGKGVISLLNISDVQSQPVLFSTFLLSLLNQLFKNLPEVGDPDKPKLIFFFDEAHLLFKNASKVFLSRVDQIIRLIRSKGVGVFFCTQAPTDIPENVLGQLGNRVQHALRAFTPNDAENLRKTVRTYPNSDFYKIDEILTQLGTGQALITVLNDKGIPTEVVATHLIPPSAVMGPLKKSAYERIVSSSDLYPKYYEAINSYSAAEVIAERKKTLEKETVKGEKTKTTKKRRSNRQTPLEAASKSLIRTLAAGAGRIILTALTGFLKGKKKR